VLSAFFAYSSNPRSVTDAVESAASQIRENGLCHIKTWKNLEIDGRLIIREITEAIDSADIFCADLTGVNDNVLFELGYAIAVEKQIFLIIDNSHDPTRRWFRELGLLSTTGYRSYTNGFDIYSQFEDFLGSDDGSKRITQRSRPSSFLPKPLLYVKGQHDTQISRRISSLIADSRIPTTSDDAVETASQTLDWYLDHLKNAAIIEFSSLERTNHEVHNKKCSLIAGLGYGFGAELMLIAEAPYRTPLDYKDILHIFSSSAECEPVLGEFLRAEKTKILEYRDSDISRRQRRRDLLRLQHIRFGEFLAELESEQLSEYYVDTLDIKRLLARPINILVGRKGTGKTATLYALKDKIQSDRRNLLCIVKPINFEIDALVELLQITGKQYERTYLVESAWKFIVYTEIAKAGYEYIAAKPSYAQSPEEQAFMLYVEAKSDLILDDFSERLEKLLSNVQDSKVLEQEAGVGEFRLRLAELIHDDMLSELRNTISTFLRRDHKIFLLIDNLDKSWRADNRLRLQCEWITGLLNVCERIKRDFDSFIVDGEKRAIALHLSIFLRSDIYAKLTEFATEPDKLQYTDLLSQSDYETLFAIIEERFVMLSDIEVSKDELWNQYIVSTVNDTPLREYIYSRIIPRPRDLVYFFIRALETAISRRHTSITELDVLEAYKQYSSWVFSSMLVENGISLHKLKDLLYELLGFTQIIDNADLFVALSEAGIPTNEDDIPKIVSHLAAISIIGYETSRECFEYIYRLDDMERITVKARRYNSGRYRIHNALIPMLELSTALPDGE
jgi:hypothetical protein